MKKNEAKKAAKSETVETHISAEKETEILSGTDSPDRKPVSRIVVRERMK